MTPALRLSLSPSSRGPEGHDRQLHVPVRQDWTPRNYQSEPFSDARPWRPRPSRRCALPHRRTGVEIRSSPRHAVDSRAGMPARRRYQVGMAFQPRLEDIVEEEGLVGSAAQPCGCSALASTASSSVFPSPSSQTQNQQRPGACGRCRRPPCRSGRSGRRIPSRRPMRRSRSPARRAFGYEILPPP